VSGHVIGQLLCNAKLHWLIIIVVYKRLQTWVV